MCEGTREAKRESCDIVMCVKRNGGREGFCCGRGWGGKMED